ncbi:HpcH/HpaI aldolase/citrate lyase family protein [Micromonospora sp. NBC_01813]|uniref:HpcH/HpaI aldolase/citrate lyase family protein n=1 Tax=Micromonospora sp. NBC_01813 TaxID=2975988 RepID=UPI002DDA1F43|nr:CoA ester lyase [Micromonospora sp. NBC_01813]WSA11234.1 CoA ester lyase [Micromonospora sp. NBC_01813]
MGEPVPPRSYLYVPGDAADKLAKAARRGADALIVDLEDAVPLAGKAAAREAVVDWLAAGPGDLPIWVRVNSGPLRDADLRAVAGQPALTGVVLAKVGAASEVAEAARLLADAADHDTLLMPMVETAAALLDIVAIARQPRVYQLQLGEVDLAGELGLEPGDDDAELAPTRSQVVVASAAAGLHPPVGPVSRITADDAALDASTRRLRRQGFVGRACIHPNQLPVVHQVYTPTAAEIRAARDTIALLETATADGTGVVLDAAGRLVDAAVLRGARRTLTLAERAGLG